MDNLKIVLNMLKTGKNGCKERYFIPEAWNTTGYGKYTRHEYRNGEIDVNPYDFMIDCIENHILPKAGTDRDFLVPLGLRSGGLGVDPGKSTIYSMLLRMFTAWEHSEGGELFQGTFLKAICLLPYLKSYGVDIIYLLPVFKYGTRYKKGEIGSPYAIKNIYKLDENLHDHLLGEYTEALLEMEFKAFVEACHILGIQVMLDFVFRTVSRDNDLMIEHPDWFYWIGLKYTESFMAPSVDRIERPLSINDKTLSYLYKSKGLKEYLSKFTPSPRDIDPEKWDKLVEMQRRTGENILDLVEAEYRITTAPGFSNVVNDRQPPWTDITYLRFYYDVHEKVRKYIDKDQPPYIMQDGICLNIYRGSNPNDELCRYISGVIPYYQKTYGIDGARIDMGHALSPELNREIVARARENNGNFILWSEEFDVSKSETAKNNGYSFISGYTWDIYKKLEKPGFNKKLISDTLMKAAIPITAALETPDTPRLYSKYKDARKIEQLVFLNCFIPNAVPFINNGLEVCEVQPMNLGLDNTEDGRFYLGKDDPMYGRLAFFDNYRIHWLNSERKWMQDLLLKAFGLRKRFIDIISRKENYVEQAGFIKNKKITFIFYFDNEACKGVFLLANRNFKAQARFNLAALLPEQIEKSSGLANILYASGNLCDTAWIIDKNRLLRPGEIVIGFIDQGGCL